MTYSESAEGIRIDRKRAAVELRRHGLSVAGLDPVHELPEYDALFGADGLCDAQALLRWLGY